MVIAREIAWTLLVLRFLWCACIALACVVGLPALYESVAPQRAASESLVEQSVRFWSWAYNLNGDYMWSVALCESSGSPAAYNPSGAQGLFQFKPATYQYALQLENADTSLAPNLTAYDPEYRSITDYDAQAHMAAWAFAHGYSYWWECA